MSSTNRGALRNKDDFYETPDWATDVIIPYLAPPGLVLEPSAGAGAMKRRLVRAWPNATIESTELDADRAAASGSNCGSFLHSELWGAYDLVITNPPFSLAIEFVEHALNIAKPNGEVAMLLRLAFLETAKRTAFHKAHPSDVYVFANRPSFTDGTSTDSAAYAWFCWGKGRGNRWELLERPAKGGAS